MSTIRDGSLTQLQQLRAAVKAVAVTKREATDEARYLARKRALEREVVGRSIKLAPRRGRRDASPDFATPVKRKKEYRSSTGLRTFHFGWTSVTRTSAPRGELGARNYTNAAANHIVYIEDGAIVRQGHTVYIDSSRVETLPDGERLVISNISDRYDERVEFFGLVDQFERVNHGDTVEIDFTINPALWQSVTSDPDCDPAVAAAFAECSDDHRPVKRQPLALMGSGSELRMLMGRHGYVFADPVSNPERLKRDGFCFHDGRGGRTEYRLVFELPREFDRDQRAMALELLCRRFEEAGCMYVAVIHAPDPHNDQDNYHVHLDFYDRKCRRLDGTADDLTNVKPQFLASIKAEIAEGRFSEEVRKLSWDFTVERTYQSNKKKKTHRPFGAPGKAKALRGRSFVRQVREGFATDINAVSRSAGLGELYDPRDYAAMGINAPASAKLGPKKHAQETKGIPTTVGIDNEAAQTEFEIRLIERAYQDRCRQIDEVQLRWQPLSEQAPAELGTRRQAVEDELVRAREAAMIRRDLDLLALERERERSRARLVSERQGRAARTGSAAARSRSADLAQAADDHLSARDEHDVALIATVSELELVASAHTPEHAAGAVLVFERQVARFEAERAEIHSEEASSSIRRNIIVKRGSLGEAGGRAKDTSDAAQAAPIPVAQPSSPVTVKGGPAEPPPPPATAAVHPCQAEALVPGSASDRASPEAISDHSIIDHTAEGRASEDCQQPHVELSAPAGGITEGARRSLLVENVPPQAPRIGGMEVADRAEPPAPHVTSTEPESTRANFPSEAAHVPPSLGESAEASSTPSRAGIRASVTAAEIKDILRPRLVGPDGIFKPLEELDQITVAKVLWAYGNLSPRARAGLGAADLYATAEGQRQADDLRLALVRGRTRLREETSRGPSNPRPQPESVLTDQDRAKQAHMQAALHTQQGRGGI